MTAAHLNAIGEGHRLAGLTLMVTVLDQRKAGFASAAIDEEAANIAIALSARKGYLDGRSLAEVFAWLRPTDLVWRYWVNNYVEGKSPAAFDVLFWNADTTRMAAALHRDMITMGLHNSLVTPGAVGMLGTPVDLNQLTTDAYVVAGVADHISPWQACYRSARMLGVRNARFVLSSSGHIASLVNPPGNPRATYRVADVDEPDPAFWAESAEQHTDSWWPDFVSWFGARSGKKKDAPDPLGGAGMAPLEPAPGSYVREH
jgi:poly(3-hydroxyalkanoate) synthetase